MSIGSTANGFLNKMVDAYFKRDRQGRLLFFPMGFGSSRIVPNADVETALRRGCRQLLIAVFAVVVPIVAVTSGLYQLMGIQSLLFTVGCLALGFACQLYTVWLSRNLARADERLSYARAVSGLLDRFGRRFQIFGLITSAIFSVAAGLTLVYPPARAEADLVSTVTVLLLFVPLTVAYAMALRRRRVLVTSE